MPLPVHLGLATAAMTILLGGCDLPPAPAASAEPPAVAENAPAVHKHRDCVYETGSRLCRDADEEQDGVTTANSGTPSIQAAKVPAGVGFR